MLLFTAPNPTGSDASSGDWVGYQECHELSGPRRVVGHGTHGSAYLAKFHVPEVVFGPDSLAELGYCALRVGGRRPFLVTDPGLIEAGWVDEAVGYLRLSGLRPVVWHDVTPNPKDHEVEAGYQSYAESGSDVIIAVGGGSCIDAAKGVAILAANDGRILDYQGVDRVVQPIPPTVMVPTTSGSGADVSQFAVITDTTEHVKVTIISRTLVPEISVIDPRLLTTMPEWLNASAGFEALAHAIEAFVSKAHNPLTDNHALHAVRLIIGNLAGTQLRPREVAPRLAMAQGSLEAGMAFTNAIQGATHAMSHQISGLLNTPQGVVNGVLLPHVIRFNAQARPERFLALAIAAGIQVQGVPPDEAAFLLADQVRALADDVGIPKGLAVLGVTEAALPRLARNTLHDACLTTNPRDADVCDIETLFHEAL
jgi:alcohol dehydrogenase class IV